NIRAAGYPPDIAAAALSLWGRYSLQFWEVTECQWQKRLDPAYVTYVDGTANYNYIARQSVSDVATKMAAFSTTGDIHRPLITVAGTMDGLLPIDHHARATRARLPPRSRRESTVTRMAAVSRRIACTKSRTATTSSRTRASFLSSSSS